MQARDAAALINRELIFKPGWEVHAMPYDRYDAVMVEAEVVTNNFNREYAPDYRGRIIAGGTFEISTRGSEQDVLRRLVNGFVEHVEEHEWREALRYKSDRSSPFHPHRPEGQALWARTAAAEGARKAAEAFYNEGRK